jgi:hypothetical protein
MGEQKTSVYTRDKKLVFTLAMLKDSIVDLPPVVVATKVVKSGTPSGSSIFMIATTRQKAENVGCQAPYFFNK